MREIRLRPRARQNGRLLQRIPQRFFEVVVGHLQVVLLGDCRAVADPGTHDVGRMLGFQFRLPTGPQVVEDPGPGFESRPLDDPAQLGPQVASFLPLDDDVLGPFRGFVPRRFAGAEVLWCAVVIELLGLGGREALAGCEVTTLMTYSEDE
ncbi:MAG: hypothetical protein CMJ65_15830 [Planctomycetaceae bacterium]|nr:hypothetical protein [Planctomycetaceae bacterium]